ncbi:Gag-Pro-Pol polyprotein [Stylophora pistillata]|uniref:Gag-Pro-Pol polyprotein n=1 Tax=Stylophora pistillata TaxID=50429 RepID=A0A2B4RY98_STYPI|nr:Gag-Pro-Pol polyprotein [Stylophora pistillata]
MASIKIGDLTSVKPFDPHGEPSSVGRRWQRWLKSFSVYADSKGLLIQVDKADNKTQRRALFLHSASEAVQEVFETLHDTGEAKDYEKAVQALSDYFTPKVNSTYQNHLFRSMEQEDGETVAQFVTRLRHVVKECEYGDQADNQIRGQVLQRCKSHELRKKLLEKGKKDVNFVRDKQVDKGKEFAKRACYRCGEVGHFGRDPECPAKGKTCHKCGGADHFSPQCKTKTAKPPKPRREEKTKGRKTKKSVRYVRSERDEDEYAFTVNSATSPEKIEVTVDGVVVTMLIDSGASTNVIDKNLWLKSKQDKIKCVSRKSDKKLYAYGSNQPLNVLGTFSAQARVEGKEAEAEFVVINGEGAALLGRETAIKLGVLKLGT